jgi:PAS domain S-box-containing protein
MADRLIGIDRETMPCDAAYMDVFDEKNLLAKGIRSYDTIDGVFRSVPAATIRVNPEGAVDRVIFFERKPVLLLRAEDPQKGLYMAPFGDRSQRSASLLYSPMIARDRIVGSLSVQSYSQNAYSEKEKELLFEIARQAGPALEAVQQYAEARRAEEALRASEARWKLSIENMLEGYALHEAILDESGRMIDYRFLEFNPVAQAILNVSREEVIGRTALEMFPHFVERGLLKRYAEVMATGKPAYIEDFYYTGDRLDKAFDIASFRIDGRHFVCMFRDVTERMKAAESLRKSEATLNSAQRLSKVGGWEWDIEKKSMSWTRETYRIHDMDPEEFVAGSQETIEKSLNCYPPDGRSLVRRLFNAASRRESLTISSFLSEPFGGGRCGFARQPRPSGMGTESLRSWATSWTLQNGSRPKKRRKPSGLS